MKRKVLRAIESILLTSMIVLSLVLLLITPLKNLIRGRVTDNALDRAREVIAGTEGNTSIQVPVSDFLSVDGENGEEEIGLQELLISMSDISSEHVNLTLLGVLKIPCIDVEEPIWDECSAVALRYGVGRFPESAEIGEDGNTILFGHRNKRSKTMLWQLETLSDKHNDIVAITTTDGVIHRYQIVDTVYASNEDIDQYLYSDFSNSEQLCIATCGYGVDPHDCSIYRPHNTIFIVICEPVD